MSFDCLDFLDYQNHLLAKHDCVFCMLMASFSDIEALKLVNLKSSKKEDKCQILMTNIAKHVMEKMLKV